eukprot:gene32263-24555_t
MHLCYEFRPPLYAKEINSGKITFNEAARTHSADKAPARGNACALCNDAGLIGWKSRGELDEDFWAAALLVEIGEFTQEPVKTVFGYHIIMVQARK